ncbi:hypothetical protein T4B_1138 [Trichinella pseudospiralis]|uniref:Uncharacterized protein n=1 Tax=Trichinella pseudospiralis TaxID=6337 RepID=A0A0V1IH46_TRIPS|nr:hypothetical protein T4B_1138 [Trichinella pseudospiralis]
MTRRVCGGAQCGARVSRSTPARPNLNGLTSIKPKLSAVTTSNEARLPRTSTTTGRSKAGSGSRRPISNEPLLSHRFFRPLSLVTSAARPWSRSRFRSASVSGSRIGSESRGGGGGGVVLLLIASVVPALDCCSALEPAEKRRYKTDHSFIHFLKHKRPTIVTTREKPRAVHLHSQI